ncbi:conjugal transfer protein TraF (plasmid) [Burkholderia aenigmatica]|uniref:conjugal transfer protein TraF n=1 Tax=Burkholderia aenigmatica TaxID=2015348 RepID=UPI003B433FDC
MTVHKIGAVGRDACSQIAPILRWDFPHAGKAAHAVLTLAIASMAVASTIASAQLVSSTQGPAARDPAYYAGKNDGWFFYNDPKPKHPPVGAEPAVATPPETSPTIPPEKPKLFSVEWLRASMPKLLDNAMNNPTPENVAAYLWSQRMMLDMTDDFKSTAEKVVASDPYLNESVRIPSATFAKRDMLFAISKAKTQIVADLAKSSGLWFFFDSQCAFCRTQYATLQRVQQNAGFTVKNISLDGASLPGMRDFVTDKSRKVFKSFGLVLTPAVVMAVPPNRFLVVAQGAMAESDLIDKIVVAAADQQLIPKELTDLVNLERRGILTQQDFAELRANNADVDDPKVLVKMMRNAVQGRLQ